MNTQLRNFFKSEKAPGLILILSTIISLSLANSGIGEDYRQIWDTKIGSHSLVHWINDGLMVIFFLLIGLELRREIVKGELSNMRDASLPIFAAIGGMAIPAAFYLLFNFGTPTQSGYGIPMATDIAFALGVLSLLGNRVPLTLKVFLTALAVIDDLGAILIIAFFYSKSLVLSNLFISLGVFVLLLTLNRFKVKSLTIYLLGGVVMWYYMLNSGVHATITGVLLAFAIPFNKTDGHSTAYKLQHFLHKPVSFLILPLFALANTDLLLGSNVASVLTQDYSLGIAAGLIIGKPLGVFFMSYLAVALGISKLTNGLRWSSILGTGFLAGIGFTMSIFITLLAFDNETVVDNAKFVILLASLVAGVIGYVLLHFTLKKSAPEITQNEI